MRALFFFLAMLAGASACGGSTSAQASATNVDAGQTPSTPPADASSSPDGGVPPDDACAPKQAHLAFDVERWDGQTFHLEADAKQSEDDGTMMLFAKFVGDHPLGVTFAISIFYPTGKVAPQTPYVSSVGSDVYMLVAHAADARPNSDATVGVATGGSIIFSQVTATECEPVGGTFDGLEYTSNNSAFPLKKIRLSNGAFRSNPL